MVVVVVGIEEEMEEKQMEKLVVKEVERWPAKGRARAVFVGSKAFHPSFDDD